jgi:4-hydroxythreonine-4-phosphate dehydrogenase
MAARRPTLPDARIVIAGDPEIMDRAASRLRPRARLRLLDPRAGDLREDAPGLRVIASSEEGWSAIEPGIPTAASGMMAARAIETAAALASGGRVDGIVTAPISKTALQAAGYPYPGHTEFLGALTRASETRMLFVGRSFRILLATVHLALRRVPDALTVDGLTRTIEIAAAALRNFRWGARRAIAVLGLNPHAGEGGLFGDEERLVIAPAIERARARGIRAEGPYPADTFFAQHEGRRDLGAVVAMYHDQGLIPAKSAGIGGAANVTLGLPFVRSSVDHGTAFDRAWKGGARAPDPAGLETAIRVGADLALRGRRPLEWTWP